MSKVKGPGMWEPCRGDPGILSTGSLKRLGPVGPTVTKSPGCLPGCGGLIPNAPGRRKDREQGWPARLPET